jgi:hypothetical protein
MVRTLRALFRRPSIRTGLARVPGRRLRDPRFVSFMAASNRKTLDTDFQDAVLQGRRLFKQALVVVLAAGGIWVVVESARALTLF